MARPPAMRGPLIPLLPQLSNLVQRLPSGDVTVQTINRSVTRLMLSPVPSGTAARTQGPMPCRFPHRVVRRLEAQRETLDFTVYDWSAWNDTYSFIQTGDPEYIESNLYPDTFLNFGFDVALFLDLDGEPVWGKVFDFPPEGGFVDLTETYIDEAVADIAGFRKRIDTGEYIDDQNTSGIVELDGIPVLFAMRPIVKSDGSGPHKGYVVFGQFLDDELIGTFSEQIVQDFSIEPVSETEVPTASDNYTLEVIDQSSLSASKIYSIKGTPSLQATAILPRNITEVGT